MLVLLREPCATERYRFALNFDMMKGVNAEKRILIRHQCLRVLGKF
jgi:beta-lactamase class D